MKRARKTDPKQHDGSRREVRQLADHQLAAARGGDEATPLLYNVLCTNE